MKTAGLMIALIFLLCGGVAGSDFGYAGASAAEGFANGCASGMARRRLREQQAEPQAAAAAATHPCPIDGSETVFMRYANPAGATEIKQVRRCLLYNHESLWPGTD